jgi:hypothetical protein
MRKRLIATSGEVEVTPKGCGRGREALVQDRPSSGKRDTNADKIGESSQPATLTIYRNVTAIPGRNHRAGNDKGHRYRRTVSCLDQPDRPGGFIVTLL